MSDTEAIPRARRGAIARGVATNGPAILSYGFRPFFLAAGVWAFVAMLLWVGAFALGLNPGGDYGSAHWHAHELLFGYTSAALAGFMLTAVPNWTGRLPVSGGPLLALVLVWLAGRLALLTPEEAWLLPAMLADALFLPVLGAIAAREIIAGRNWRNLPVIGVVTLLTCANVYFHWSVVTGDDTGLAYRLAISGWVMLISLFGGRLGVSFTRNWLARRGETQMPTSFGNLDRLSLAVSAATLALWIAAPEAMPTGFASLTAAGVVLARLSRWQGIRTWREPLVLVLHTSFLFIPLGFLAIGLSAFGVLSTVSALHLLTVGAIANMTVAVMTRATRGHTGRVLSASRITTAIYACLFLSALLRPVADLVPDLYLEVLELSALLWILAFGLFIVEHSPMLLRRRVDR